MISLENEIRQRLGKQSNINIDNNYEVWLDCYHGEPFWLRTVEEPQSLNLCAAIPSELARLTTIELETKVTDEELDKFYQKEIKKIRNHVEFGLALGGIIFKPYVTSKDIHLDVVTPDMYVILGFTTFGDINHIVFLDRIRKYEMDRYVYYTRLEEHIIDKKYTVINTAYKSKQETMLGDKVPLNSVEEWSGIKDKDILDSEKPLFSYFKNPQANNLDTRSQEGISCFARALSLIQDADEQYQRILWEYKGSELAIDADVTVVKKNGELPAGKERLFRNLGLDQKDGFYQVFSPDIRDSSLFNGLNQILRQIEFTCGLAYGTLSEIKETAKTATEIKMSKQRSYATVVDIQNELENCLRDLVDIFAYWCKKLNIQVSDKYEVEFDFDDSLIVDSENERNIRLQEVAAGILTAEEYHRVVYGVEDTTGIIPNVEETHIDIIEEE